MNNNISVKIGSSINNIDDMLYVHLTRKISDKLYRHTHFNVKIKVENFVFPIMVTNLESLL